MNKNNFQIIQINSNLAIVSNYKDKEFVCKIRGKFKHSNLKPLVGDFVTIEKINDEYLITDILKRNTHIIRPNVANIETIILIQSIIQPNFNFHLLMKYLAYYEYYISNVIIVLTKFDICTNSQIENTQKYIDSLKKGGYKVIELPNKNNLNNLKDTLKNKLFCIVGNSGVGKSTLINSLIINLNLKTQEISKALNRGKHTTTTATIINKNDYLLMDTPGFSSIDINLLTKQQFANSYHDFKKLSLECKFSNCLHDKEINCAIKNAVNIGKISNLRYEQYLEILKEIK